MAPDHGMPEAWRPNALINRLYERSVSKHADIAALPLEEQEAARAELRGKLKELLGSIPEQADELSAVVMESVDCGDYIREKVEFRTYDDLTMLAYVLVPQAAAASGSERRPAVLAVHGHGYGSKEVVGLTPTGEDNTGNPNLYKHFAVELARRGFVVIAPELLGFGERRMAEDAKAEPGGNSCFRLASSLMLMGQSLAGVRVYELLRTVDYAFTRPEIDPQRIGVMGMSGGGMVTALASALDVRFGATVVSGYTNLFKTSIMDRNHCLDNYVPGLLQYGEMPDWIGLIAPRPLFIESGSGDTVFPIRGSREAVARLQRIYDSANNGEAFGYEIFEGKHEISGAQSYQWLVSQLMS
ncbi:dienelactone hydrolase family protein [Paenibacillus doosanensis]|uniref:alpha/beta hydrolase family protein n=1 Tax=Paenibacillus doosanensis TaxID=1229154 RepID=UPI00217FBA37|nr:alpha/beta hydrolase family protein [Paenibacillus doosanensis]MCS7463511.1 dienelactone hydrolase family protein [Paenibacillus doosanensis]